MNNLLRPEDSRERQIEKLDRIIAALMGRVEAGDSDTAFSHFQAAAALEAKVRARTRDLEDALAELNISRARLDQARQEAENARADLAGALEAVKEGFALFAADGRMIMSNSRFARLFPDIHPNIRAGLLLDEYFALVAASPALVPSDGISRLSWLAERRRRHRERRASFILELTGDRWIQVAEQSTPNGGTAILQTEVTAMMRQERLERDKVIDEQARLIRATLDHLDQGVAIFGRDNTLIGWNIRILDLLPLPLDMMRVGAGFQDLFNFLEHQKTFTRASHAERIIQWVQRFNRSQAVRGEVETKAGNFLTFALRAMPDGGFVISFSDVTGERIAQRALAETNETLEARVVHRTKEFEKARNEAQQANRAKTRFLAAASHDVLQPLNAAKLFIASVDETALPGREVMLFTRISSAFASVEAILRTLLDISKLDSPTMRIEKKSIDLNMLFEKLAEAYRAAADQKGLVLRYVPTRKIITSDPVYLQRILQNLIVNAITYTRQGKVLFGVRTRNDGRLDIVVHDTGPGIAEADQDVIFEDFQRLDNGADNPQGMGLGLAIVKKASLLLGHELALKSQEGKGTCFRLTVDVAANMDPPRIVDFKKPAPYLPFDNMIVVVIENEQAVREAMVGLLDQWGISPLPSSRYEDAIRLLDEIGEAPDAIVADFHLDEGKTGLEAILKLREIYGEIPAIIVTANQDEGLVEFTKRCNINVLHKPLEPEALQDWLVAAVKK